MLSVSHETISRHRLSVDPAGSAPMLQSHAVLIWVADRTVVHIPMLVYISSGYNNSAIQHLIQKRQAKDPRAKPPLR